MPVPTLIALLFFLHLCSPALLLTMASGGAGIPVLQAHPNGSTVFHPSEQDVMIGKLLSEADAADRDRKELSGSVEDANRCVAAHPLSHNGCPSSGYVTRLPLQDTADVRMHGGEGATESTHPVSCTCRQWLPSACLSKPAGELTSTSAGWCSKRCRCRRPSPACGLWSSSSSRLQPREAEAAEEEMGMALRRQEAVSPSGECVGMDG